MQAPASTKALGEDRHVRRRASMAGCEGSRTPITGAWQVCLTVLTVSGIWALVHSVDVRAVFW